MLLSNFASKYRFPFCPGNSELFKESLGRVAMWSVGLRKDDDLAQLTINRILQYDSVILLKRLHAVLPDRLKGDR